MRTVFEECFSNPYNNPTDIKDLLLDYDEWAAEYLQKSENERPDFSDPDQFEFCNIDGESVFKPYDEWFGAEVTGCDFKIQLQSQYYNDAGNDERSSQSTIRYSMKNLLFFKLRHSTLVKRTTPFAAIHDSIRTRI